MILNIKIQKCKFKVILPFAVIGGAGSAAAVFLQFLLAQSHFYTFWNNGLLILAFGFVLIFLDAWYFLSRTFANYFGRDLKETLPLCSGVFAPALMLFAVPFMPVYNRQRVPLQLLAIVLLLTLIAFAFFFREQFMTRNKGKVKRLLDLRASLALFAILPITSASLRLHDLYFVKAMTSSVTRASYDRPYRVKFVKTPGTFRWNATIPANGVFEVVLFPNTHFPDKKIVDSVSYRVRIISESGKKRTISEGKLDHEKDVRIRFDTSHFAGEKAQFILQVLTPFSFEELLDKLHTLLRPSLWSAETKNLQSSSLMPVYWSEPIVYATRTSRDTNVLLLVVDTLRADHLHCYGYEKNTSPAIDRLAKSGVRFASAISQAPWTLPSMASLYTGRLPSSHKAGAIWHDPLYPRTFWSEFSSQPNFIDMIEENGYFTVGFVNNQFLGFCFGADQGFNEYHIYSGTAKTGSDLFSHWLNDNADKKFFCLLHFLDPHDPYQKHPENNSFESAYDSEIAFTDYHIGRVIDQLDDMGLRDNTLIVLVADHGEEFGEHGTYQHGRSLYNQLLHVPLIFSLPRALPHNKTVTAQVRVVDVFPTVFDILGLNFKRNHLEGKSLLALLSDNSFQKLPAISEFLIQEPEMKCIQYNGYKLIVRQNPDEVHLYNTIDDPDERIDLADREPEMCRYLQEQLEMAINRSLAGNSLKMKVADIDDETRESLKALGYLK